MQFNSLFSRNTGLSSRKLSSLLLSNFYTIIYFLKTSKSDIMILLFIESLFGYSAAHVIIEKFEKLEQLFFLYWSNILLTFSSTFLIIKLFCAMGKFFHNKLLYFNIFYLRSH